MLFSLRIPKFCASENSLFACDVRGMCFCALLTPIFVVLILQSGCTANRYVRMQPAYHNESMAETSWDFSLAFSERTTRTLKSYHLEQLAKKRPSEVLVALRRECDEEITGDLVFAFAEIAYSEAETHVLTRPRLAAEMYIAAAQYAYTYLFSPKFSSAQNQFDQSFRAACLIYNGSVESILRLGSDAEGVALQPNRVYVLKTESGEFRFRCEQKSGIWNCDSLQKFRFGSNYQVTGLSQEFRQSGLGVPLIAERKIAATPELGDRYYPPQMTFPVSAFLRFTQQNNEMSAVLELHDPLMCDVVEIGTQKVPLETDLTTPQAYYLAKISGYLELVRMAGFFRPDSLASLRLRHVAPQLARRSENLLALKSPPTEDRKIMGLTMLQHYSPEKIPVVFIHGLGSSPLTWIEMAGSLQSEHEIREKYQFWFFFYPTGQPVWVSAALLRRELAELRATLDPEHRAAALDEMILVGHSMGGLIAQMQTVDSGNEIWELVSNRSFDETTAKLSVESRETLREWFFFQANSSVQHVIAIATPFHGSDLSNSFTQWMARRAVQLPHNVQSVIEQAEKECPLTENSLLHLKTSLGSLATKSPILPKIVELSERRTQESATQKVAQATYMPLAPRAPAAEYHTIIGVEKMNPFLEKLVPPSDGVVLATSAHFPSATSEIQVTGKHRTLHDEPRSIQEVRRVLKEHLRKTKR